MYQSLQISRAIAALLVTCFHLGGNLHKPKYLGEAASTLEHLFSFGGQAGVAFFFVLSGFIISRVHWKDIGQTERLKGYLQRRLARVYPPYLLVFALVYAMAMALPATRQGMVTDPHIILKALLLIPQAPDLVGATGAPVIIVAWTLQYEILFYMAFALAIAGKRLALFGVIGYLLLLIGKWSGVLPDHWLLSFLTRDVILLFALGIAADRVSHHFRKLPAPGVGALIFAGLFAAVAAWDIQQPGPNRGDFYLAYGCVSVFLVICLVAKENQKPAFFKNRTLTLIGDASYSQYLIHFPLISVACKMVGSPTSKNEAFALFVYLAILGACVMASIIFHKKIELPMVRILQPRNKSSTALPTCA